MGASLMEDKRIESILMAKYLLNKAYEKEIPMNMTKLQKMLYALDGILLANGANVINENCRAWQYGPVYPKVFAELSNGYDFIKPFKDENFSSIENNEHKDLIDRATQLILDKLGDKTGRELSVWSHRKGSPWDNTPQNEVIDKTVIKRYFLYGKI